MGTKVTQVRTPTLPFLPSLKLSEDVSNKLLKDGARRRRGAGSPPGGGRGHRCPSPAPAARRLTPPRPRSHGMSYRRWNSRGREEGRARRRTTAEEGSTCPGAAMLPAARRRRRPGNGGGARAVGGARSSSPRHPTGRLLSPWPGAILGARRAYLSAPLRAQGAAVDGPSPAQAARVQHCHSSGGSGAGGRRASCGRCLESSPVLPMGLMAGKAEVSCLHSSLPRMQLTVFARVPSGMLPRKEPA